jgi:hypothetical protein
MLDRKVRCATAYCEHFTDHFCAEALRHDEVGLEVRCRRQRPLEPDHITAPPHGRAACGDALRSELVKEQTFP